MDAAKIKRNASQATSRGTRNRRSLKIKPRKLSTNIAQGPSTTNRIVDSVAYPETYRLTDTDVFMGTDKPSLSTLIAHFRKEGRLRENVAIRILVLCTKIFRAESTLLDLDSPINICGDIHGQFFDLIRLFAVGGDISENKYLFLGDYVDRGPFGIEVVIILFSMKILYPNNIFLVRGNHECRHLTETFTFKRECELKYSLGLYDIAMEAFDCLPLAALVNRQFLCMHGGISPDINNLNDIKKINRFREPPIFGAMCDLLWADPAGNYDTGSGPDLFTHNFARNCSYFFSYAACCDFLKRNRLNSIIRAHEVQPNGFRMYKKSIHSGYPSLITIFSAPNYLDLFRNKAALIKYSENNINIQQFAHSPHPYWLPNFMDVFSWSLPFMAERITEIFIAVLNICSDDELLVDEYYKDEELKMRHDLIRNKIRALGKIALVYSDKRDESETLVKLRGAAPTKAILKVSPMKTVNFNAAVNGLKQSGNYSHDIALEVDLINEQYPYTKEEAAAVNI